MNPYEFGRPGGTVPVQLTVRTNSPNSRRLTSQRILRVLLSPTRMVLPKIPNHYYNLWPNRWGFCPLKWRLFDRKSTSCGRSFVLSFLSNQLLSYRLVCLLELRAMTDLAKTVELRVDRLCEATNALSSMRVLLSTFSEHRNKVFPLL